MALSNAERQKAYRDRKRLEVAEGPPDPPLARPCARCLVLEEEVRHLKAELAELAERGATRLPPVENPITAAWNRSRPAPKRN